jgi:alpha-tubulin suppressor-like RCC1 family protein
MHAAIFACGSNQDQVLGTRSDEEFVQTPEYVLFDRELTITSVCCGDDFAVALTGTTIFTK